MKRLIIRNGRLFDPSIKLDKIGDVVIEGSKIVDILEKGQVLKYNDAEILDATNKLIVPGLIDIHVHFREPGFEQKETIASGSSAAVAGGFTTVCCMPNTNPVIDSVETTKYIIQKAKEANLCKVLPIGAITLGEKGETISNMPELKEAGCVAFSDDGRPVESSLIMRKALEVAKELNTTLSLHEQDLLLSENFAMNEGEHSQKLGVGGMPNAAEDVMIARDIEIAALVDAPIHFCHVSTRRGALLVKRAKEDDIPVTAESTPHNFSLIDQDVGLGNTFFKMSPPLRRPEDVQAIIDAIGRGIIDCIVSDHAPHEAAVKQIEFQKAACGVIGLQTILPLTLKLVHQGKISLSRAIDALTAAPRRAFMLESVNLSKNSVADITIIDSNMEFKFTQQLNRSKSVNGPFFDWVFKGCATTTIVDGKVVFDIGELNIN